MCGGFGNEKVPTEEEQTLLLAVKGDVENRLGHPVNSLKVLKYTTQVVAGVNYLMKVNADEKIIHVKIHKPLPHRNAPPEIMTLETEGHTRDSPL